MNTTRLSTTSDCQDRLCLLTLTGELDHHTAPQLREAPDQLPLADSTLLVMDLAALTFCDSTGLTTLVAAHRRASASGTDIALAGLTPSIAKSFRITGLDQLFPIHASAAEALSAPAG
ncbi:STAS domain-containing protein [Streptomyces sp. NPDC060035]|uniref:STAS domain-containing protein n=1 Tax=Streptomyces sp. NPDC060035 TaxID=3347044 RepID=UPI0036B6DA26